MPYPVWLLLGEASALCERLTGVSLPSEQGALVEYATLLRGVLGNATLDDNTLTEDQVDRLFEGTLQLPPSQQFLGMEVKNLVKAVRWAQDRVKAGDQVIGPWVVQALHVQVLKGLPIAGDHPPGEYRTARNPGSGGAGVPPDDIPVVIDRLSEWLRSSLFAPQHSEERIAFAIIRAVLAHLYVQWTKPFPEGNGRTARLLEFQLLIGAGVPALAAHRMAMHAAATRSDYQRQLTQAAQAGGDPLPFITYMVRGLVDGLHLLWADVEEIQHQAFLEQRTGEIPTATGSANGARQLRLLQDLRGHGAAVPPARIPQLSAELARYYARLNPKTLQRDLHALQQQGLLERTPEGVRAKPLSLKPFRSLAAGTDSR